MLRVNVLTEAGLWWSQTVGTVSTRRLQHFSVHQIVWQRQYDVHQLQSCLRRAICQFHSNLAWRIKDVFETYPGFLFYRHQHYACTHV